MAAPAGGAEPSGPPGAFLLGPPMAGRAGARRDPHSRGPDNGTRADNRRVSQAHTWAERGGAGGRGRTSGGRSAEGAGPVRRAVRREAGSEGAGTRSPGFPFGANGPAGLLAARGKPTLHDSPARPRWGEAHRRPSRAFLEGRTPRSFAPGGPEPRRVVAAQSDQFLT